ncbi:unnamed protein product, partial [Rotaria magnacalcarata]
DILVDDLLSHQDGLPYVDQQHAIDDVLDWNRMTSLLTEQNPYWKPGSTYGYHFYTMGFLVGEFIQRIDPQHCTYMPVDNVEACIAPLVTKKDSGLTNLSRIDPLTEKSMIYSGGFSLKSPSNSEFIFNEPRIHQAVISSANGISNAYSMLTLASSPQINLYYTDWIDENETAVQHNCFRVIDSSEIVRQNHEIISYCMSELPSEFHIGESNDFPKFTFVELSTKNITSQQLYLWSAPIDLIEHYQFYLNHLLISNDTSLANEVFYNCTFPRFGPMCQYEIIYYHEIQTSLNEIINDYYHNYIYDPINFTCYTHLQCNRGPSPACLDWSEICNGQIDCLDGEFDEEHCWQLEINECEDDEYRCANGQCIPQSFYRDGSYNVDCVDSSDEVRSTIMPDDNCFLDMPTFRCEDQTCRVSFLTNSCVLKRQSLLLKAIYSVQDDSVPTQCWSAFKCIIDIPDMGNRFCNNFCSPEDCVAIIEKNCPPMFNIPNVPILYGNIYIAHNKRDSLSLAMGDPSTPYLCFNNSRYDQYFINRPKILLNNRTCFHPSYSSPSYIVYDRWEEKYGFPLYVLHADLRPYNLIINYTSEICNRSNMYQCVDSHKCISEYRLMDNALDCPQGDDENITESSHADLIKRLKHFVKCEIANKYIHQSSVADTVCDCEVEPHKWCEDENLDIVYIKKNISFQITCDGFIEMIPIVIEGKNETDETECEQWSCNNMYTHCDDIWNCPNGEDEIDCFLSSKINCSSNDHLCVSPYTNQFIRLPLSERNDGKIDCIGGTDEPKHCSVQHSIWSCQDFKCRNQTSSSYISSFELCNNKEDCNHGDDEQFCKKKSKFYHIPSYLSSCL